MKMIKIDHTLINFDHVIMIENDIEKPGEYSFITTTDQARYIRVNCYLNDLIRYLETAGVDIARIDTKQQTVTVKDKTGD